MAPKIEIVASTRAILGESPFWDSDRNCLWWVDIDGGRLHRLDDDDHDSVVFETTEPLGSAIIKKDGTFILALGKGLVELDSSGNTSELALSPSGDRFNDAKCDPKGRLYVGSLTYDRTPGACALYRFDRRNGLVAAISGVTLSNGMGWSPSGEEMYFIDTPTRTIQAYHYDPEEGRIGEGRVLVDFAEVTGNPDGMAVDSAGCIWVVMARAGFLRRISPSGETLEVIKLPSKFTTSCCFGGRDLDRLYITSGTFKAGRPDPDEPFAGSIFALDPGVKGLNSQFWAGK